MITQKLNIWNHLTDTTNNHDAFLEFEKRFCGTILEIFVKNTKEPFKFFGIYKEFNDSTKRHIFMDVQNNLNFYEFTYDADVFITIPKLEKGYYEYYKKHSDISEEPTLELAYVINNALRQWKRGICKATYTLESVTEYIKDNYIFLKEQNNSTFLKKMGNVLITREERNPNKTKFLNLQELFENQNFVVINNNFVIIKSLNTTDTYDLLYHKFWVGHTKDLKTLTIRDHKFKQEIYDLLNTTNLEFQIIL